MATRFDVAATGGTLFNTDAASFALNPNLRAEAFQVRDNSKFVKVFDPAKIIDVFKPTRTLVVSQNPAPGSLVPVGTPVDLIVTVKESIPLGGLKELDPRVVERFNNKNIGDVLLTLQGSDAKNVLDRAGATDSAS